MNSFTTLPDVHRSRTVLAVIGSLLLACVPVASTSGATHPALNHLPDLVELPPSELLVIPGPNDTWLLGFTSIAGNNGVGPMRIVATRTSATATFVVSQVITRADRSTWTRPTKARLMYQDATGHNHFHLAQFEHYELRNAAGTVLARDTKAGYCLGDRTRLGTAAGPAIYTGQCGRGQPGLLKIVEGMSVGWADPYAIGLPGQSFALTGLPAGTYTLVNRVNDQSLYLESNYSNNVGSAQFSLAWPDGANAKPTVTVIKTCLADRC